MEGGIPMMEAAMMRRRRDATEDMRIAAGVRAARRRLARMVLAVRSRLDLATVVFDDGMGLGERLGGSAGEGRRSTPTVP